MRRLVWAIAFVIGTINYAFAQAPAADPHHPAPDAAPASQSSGVQSGGTPQSGQGSGSAPQMRSMMHGMMGGGMMDKGMMGGGMMNRHPRGAMGGGMMMRMMFSLMDADGDGSISLQEFQAAHERIFKGIDQNKDGRLTMEEMQSFMEGAGPAR